MNCCQACGSRPSPLELAAPEDPLALAVPHPAARLKGGRVMANKHSKHGFVPRLCRLALGAGFVALSATAARAEPTTYWEAEAKAEQYQKQAQQYRDLGGAGYKSGLVRQADTEAAKY